MKLLTLIFVLIFMKPATQEKIIIIGAGSSGIAAATRLLENEIKDILILEAEPITGGRIKTINVDGRDIDLGAEWCHGEKDNIVYEKLADLNLTNLLHHDESPIQFYISSRSNISYTFSEELLKLIIDLAYEDEFGEVSNKSLGEVLTERYDQIILKKFTNDTEKLRFAKLARDYFHYETLSSEAAFSWYDVAADAEFLECDGDQMLGWNNGFFTFLDVLTKKLPNPKNQLPIDDKIKLNKEVIKITYDVNNTDNTPIRIMCSDNSTYTAKHVIVTPSLGFLKENAEELFEPKLSKNKLDAIKNIGFGAVLKVFITFKSNWWGSLPGFNFVWTEEDKLASRTMFPHGPANHKGQSWIVENYCIFIVPNSNIFLVWFTGDMVPIIETMDKNVLKDGIDFTLNLFLGHLFNIPKSEKLIRTTWNSNPHFRGTYSFDSINSNGAKDIKALQNPILNFRGDPLVQFAGEATNVLHHSTVHGAIETGYREADRLIKFYSKA